MKINQRLAVYGHNKNEVLLNELALTEPPILIFCENKQEVTALQQFLISCSINTDTLHGGRTKQERARALDQFLKGRTHVLVATDVAARGLDFKIVKHVINFDLPKDMDFYL